MDLGLRRHPYRELLKFLERQVPYVQDATTERDFAQLLPETESQLLGETANRVSRRSFIGVAQPADGR